MTIIEQLNTEMMEVKDFLLKSSQLSLVSNVEKNLTKLYALSMASYFEKEIQTILIEYISRISNNSSHIESFVRKKAISMQYHTFFVWGEKDQIDKPGKNANAFFSLFGEDIKNTIESDIKNNKDLDESVKAFLEIGHIRNILVHSNFAAYNFDSKTTQELFTLFCKAEIFITYTRNKFRLIT